MGVKRKRHTPAWLNQYVVEAPIGENEDNNEISFRRTIYEIIDKVTTELDKRFTCKNIDLIEGVMALNPASVNFLNEEKITIFAKCFDINLEAMLVKVKNLKFYIERKEPKMRPKTLLNFQAHIRELSDDSMNWIN